MGFYLPGLGESLGTALRLKAQQETMDSVKGIIGDESKPWSERSALIVSAHPELANNEQFKAMDTMRRQAEEDQYQNEQRAKQTAMDLENKQFKTHVEALNPEQRAILFKNEPDLAKRNFPAEYEAQVAADTAAANEEKWLAHNKITYGQQQATAAASADRADARAQMKIDAEAAKPKAPVDMRTVEQKNTDALAQDEAKQRQTAAIKAETEGKIEKAASDELTTGIESYMKKYEDTGKGNYRSNEDLGKLEAQHVALKNAWAREQTPGDAEPNSDLYDRFDQIVPPPTRNTAFEKTGIQSGKEAVKLRKQGFGKPVGTLTRKQ